MNTPARLAPHDLASLAAALDRATTASRIIAGGTDLTLQLRGSGMRPDLLIDLSGVRELSFVRREAARIFVGALTPFAVLEANATLARDAGCLAQAASQVGSVQIRNVATLGGNVANASACADAVPALLVLDADVGVLAGDGVVRRRPLREVIAEAGGIRLHPGEAITDFSFPALGASQFSAFRKVGVRTSVAVSKLNAALVLTLDEAHQRILSARIAFGSVAPTAFISEAVSESLRGNLLTDATVEHLAAACAALVEHAIPERGSMPYKRRAVRGLAYDLWTAATVASLA